MLFMVVERFQPDALPLVGERFRTKGRMLPAGASYVASWVESNGSRCFQIMEAASMELLQSWAAHWDDLVDFEIVPVLESTEFWAKYGTREPGLGAQG
jgi:hypothetical protein